MTTLQGAEIASLSGAVGGGSEQVVLNELTHRPIEENVIKSTLIAGATAAVFRGAESVIAPRVASALPNAARELSPIAAKTTSTLAETARRTGRKVTEALLKSAHTASVGLSTSSPPPPSHTEGLVGALGGN